MIQDLTSSKTQRWLRVLVDTKQTQLHIQLGNNFLACTQDVTIVWRRIFTDVLKRYDLRRKSCGKPVCCIARISMSVIRSIGKCGWLLIMPETCGMFCIVVSSPFFLNSRNPKKDLAGWPGVRYVFVFQNVQPGCRGHPSSITFIKVLKPTRCIISQLYLVKNSTACLPLIPLAQRI
jgi:hypothetical protein